jgi:hypothetical protein
MSTRDPSHCLDLIGKDSTKVACFQKLYSETMDLYDFLTTDRVSGIVDALFDDGRLTRFAKPTKHSETTLMMEHGLIDRLKHFEQC